MVKNRDFTIKGHKFHLDDLCKDNKFSYKYSLLVWSDVFESWHCIGYTDTKKDAIFQAKQWLHC